MCRLKIVFCNFGLVVKLAPLAVKSVFACYHYFDIYVTEYGTALTTILPILFLYLNTGTVTAGTFEP
jgi:hypothetical protein